MPWRCAGCGIEVPDDLTKQCDCTTMVACRGGENKWMKSIGEPNSEVISRWELRCSERSDTDTITVGVGNLRALIASWRGRGEALEHLLHAVCGETGFANAVRADTLTAYPWPALDLAEEEARYAISRYRKGGK